MAAFRKSNVRKTVAALRTLRTLRGVVEVGARLSYPSLGDRKIDE
jgi:hypothetical protein